MPLSNEDFVLQAHPHSWFLVADNLHEQALLLHRNLSASSISRVHGASGAVTTWAGSNRALFLVCGFALENAIKAFLVYENPHWISNGRLSRELRSHSLVALAAKSTLLPYKRRGKRVLSVFERGIESWARYPCALTAEESEEQQILTEDQWSGYVQLAKAYGRRLKALLSKQWKGPHGFVGHFRISGEFLGAS